MEKEQTTSEGNMKVERISNHKWKLLCSYQNPVFPDIIIEPNFEWDGASIPSIARSIISNSDRGVLESSCTHDLLYASKGEIEGLKLTRKQVDVIFRHELQFYGVNGFKAYLAYKAVRMFGGSHWKK